MLVVVSVDFLFGDFGTQFINDCSGASISALSVSSLILSLELSSQKLRRAKSIFLDFLTKASSFPAITTLNNWIISCMILSHCASFIELPCIVLHSNAIVLPASVLSILARFAFKTKELLPAFATWWCLCQAEKYLSENRHYPHTFLYVSLKY